jgi:hypothetical protein
MISAADWERSWEASLRRQVSSVADFDRVLAEVEPMLKQLFDTLHEGCSWAGSGSGGE